MTKSQKLKGLAPTLAAILSIILFFTVAEKPDRSQSWAMIKSAVAISIMENDDYEVAYYNENGQYVVKRATQLLRDYDAELATLVTAGKLVFSIVSFFILWMLLSLLFRLAGTRLDSMDMEETEDERVIEAEELRKIASGDICQSRIAFAGIPLPGKSDISNLIFCGSSGSGKSVNLRDLLASMRKSGRKVVVFDPSGEMISHFYRSDKDIILNPLDKRSAAWDVWCDCLRYDDYLQVANTLIEDLPEHKNWITGARLVLAHLADSEGQKESPDYRNLIHAIENLNDNNITDILHDTEAAPVIAEFGEQACFGIRGVLLSSIKPFPVDKYNSSRFSVRRWAFNETSDSWLFISTKASESDTCKPLTATWLNLAAKTLMNLNADHLRRVFLVIDDISATNKISCLMDYMVRAKRTGASAILTTHSINMLTSIYGEDDTKTLLRACEGIVAMTCNDPNTQHWLSSRLGSKDTVEKTEVSYGNSDQKIFTQRILKLPLITEDDIGRLPQMQGYVRFGHDYPTARFHSAALEMAVIAPPFVPGSDQFFEFDDTGKDLSNEGRKEDKEESKENIKDVDLEAMELLNPAENV